MEWISTGDRLPESWGAEGSDEIIIYGPDIGVISGIHYWGRDKVFGDEFDATFAPSEVTHWMPLPQPSKESE